MHLFDYIFKILLIGNTGVGKTSFLRRYIENKFDPSFRSTVGIDFRVKTIVHNHNKVRLQIWDTAGQERYQAIITAYYHGANGFILMYDITNEQSFRDVRKWVNQMREMSWSNAVIILVGNKSDLKHKRVVTYESGKHLADELGLEFFETSAKDNINVKKVFERIVDLMIAASWRGGMLVRAKK